MDLVTVVNSACDTIAITIANTESSDVLWQHTHTNSFSGVDD